MTVDRLVVYGPEVLAEAASFSSPTFRNWPSPPAQSFNRAADALAVPLRHSQWGFVICGGVLSDVATILESVHKMTAPTIAVYLEMLGELAHQSGGGLVPSSEDDLPFGPGVSTWLRRVAGAALYIEADAVVLSGPRLPLSAGDWNGCWVTTPDSFATHAHLIQ